MLKVNKTLLKNVQEKMTIPEGFDVKVFIDDMYNDNTAKGLAFKVRKIEGPTPRYVEDIFDFGVWFWNARYGEGSKTTDEYIERVNNALVVKARAWEKLLEKQKKEDDKAKAEAEKEAKKAEKKRKKEK